MSKLVPIRDAAVALGLSERTVRRRIEANQLLALKDAGPRGNRCLVVLEDDAPRHEEPTTADQPTDSILDASVQGSAQHPLTDRLAGSLEDRLTFAEDQLRFLQTHLLERTRETEQLHTLLSQALGALPTGPVGPTTSSAPVRVAHGGGYADGGPPDEPTPRVDRPPDRPPGRGLGRRRGLRAACDRVGGGRVRRDPSPENRPLHSKR